MKRLPIWFILGMLSVFFGAPVFAQDATLAIGNGAGTPGSTFTVPISMNNSVEVQGLQFIVTDERDVVDVESLTRSNRLTSRGFTLSSNSVSPTRTNVVLFKFGTTGLPS
ncbi:MAG: cohesin domain-containing protein, partial [bacterium]|nr:cohesin domain-containing protein [bacterium]